MELIALEPERVKFAGLRERRGSMTLGQLNILEWINGAGTPVDARLDWVLDLPGKALISDITETFAVMLARHEGLRTSYLATDPPVQRAAAEGELVIDAFAMEQAGPAAAETEPEPDRHTLTTELFQRLRIANAAATEDETLPIQVALVRRGDEVLAAAALCSHLAVDLHAAGLICREFAELVRDPQARAAGPAHCQPLDRAEAEQNPRADRRLAAAIGYWERQLAQMPKHVYVGPRVAATSESGAVVLTSPAAGQALDRIAQRTRQSRVAVVFAVVCVAISQRTGYERWSAPLMSGNRFEPSLTEYIGTVAQSAAVDIDVSGAGLDETIGRISRATFTAYRHGLYNIYDRRAAEDRIGTGRGVDFCLEPLFNGVDGGSGEPEAPPAEYAQAQNEAQYQAENQTQTRLEWFPMPPTSTLMRFDMRPVPHALKLQCWTGDTARTPRADMESLLLAVERLLVAGAAHDLDPDHMRRIGGLEPLARGDDWLLIDQCWVEPNEVQRLLEDALPSVTPRVFRSVEDQAEERELVAYIPAGPQALTPEQAHARCMAQLPGRPSAMTPRWYVICDGTPSDPSDASAWRALAVLAQGPGRAL